MFLGLKFLFLKKYIMSEIQTGLLNFEHHICFDILQQNLVVITVFRTLLWFKNNLGHKK
jgi:hypothetical protein